MRAGRLDREVEIEREVVTRDSDYGSAIKRYEFEAKVWAQYKPVPTETAFAERFKAEAIRALEMATFIIRYYEGLSPIRHRLVMDGKRYNIKHVTDGGRHRARMLEVLGEAEIGAPLPHEVEIPAASIRILPAAIQTEVL